LRIAIIALLLVTLTVPAFAHAPVGHSVHDNKIHGLYFGSSDDLLSVNQSFDDQWHTEIAERKAKERPVASVSRSAPAPAGDVWHRLMQCEAGSAGGWSANTGNGYYGGLQFSLSSWQSVGGTGYPHEHSAAEQIARGQALQRVQGWGAWPGCSAKLGLR